MINTILLILRNLPAALSLLVTLTTVLKSDEVKDFLDTIRKTALRLKSDSVNEPAARVRAERDGSSIETETEVRQGLFSRFKDLLAQNTLDLDDQEFGSVQRVAKRWREAKSSFGNSMC